MNEQTKYLYGASVQGIQDFIFQTNKLKEIVGASELVAQICTTAFDEYGKNGTSIVRAAGNIKFIFNNEIDCKEAVKSFPKKVMTMAPGITISQAVVTLKDDLSDYAEKSNELEQKLISQRNKPNRPLTLGLTAISRAPSTGFPAVTIDEEGALIDEASACKQNVPDTAIKLAKKSFGEIIKYEQIAREIDKITGKNNWIAIIHADGNGIGSIVRAVGENKNDMKKFSGMLDDITTKAANEAFNSVKERFENLKTIPIRPVVLSGDDMTTICRADLAIDYTHKFLEVFEKESKEQFKGIKLQKVENQSLLNNGLTACAGISFVKSSYPFHYGISLAESLCSRAKKTAKEIDRELAPSCLMFHKVQDSFVENFSKIAKRELQPDRTKLNFEAGPYYCGERATKVYAKSCSATISKLIDNVSMLEKSPVKSHLRNWISTLFDNVEAANQQMKRLRKVNEDAKVFIDEKYEKLSPSVEMIIPFHDMLSLASILQTDTNTKNK